ncbi:hypothetical protein HMN09_01038700 [Mycena chlorophos]|uniref:Uncharacterized protein n=1 Tax=Mycena chlorophos TaxID=658473 RepID=A0A8H6VXX9_MYCCL|nr:hypothetical protein HMN09_01038700 [Mycena chlorophos]
MDARDLPAFLDPLLEYLADQLPSPLYSFLINLLSHLLALAFAVYSLVAALLSTHPLQWDAQTVLPPLIALLTSYLAVLSLYRTTAWMFRTSFFFVKWGTILGGFIALASWLLAQQDANGLAGRGMVGGIGGLVLSILNGDGQNGAGGRRTRSKPKRTQQRKPKAWESWDRHREWQYQEEQAPANEDAFADLMNVAGDWIREGSWWKTKEPTEEDKKAKTRSR